MSKNELDYRKKFRGLSPEKQQEQLVLLTQILGDLITGKDWRLRVPDAPKLLPKPAPTTAIFALAHHTPGMIYRN